MADPARKRLTVAEFLAWDDGTDRRYELVNGEIVAMAPALTAHGMLVSQLTIAIGTRLRPPCRIIGEAGLLLPHRNDAFYQADLAVTCVPNTPGERCLTAPVLIVEVLSPTTVSHDRGVKLPDYREIPSLQEILLLSSEARRAELWQRTDTGWAVRDLAGGAALRLETVPAALSLADLYEGIAFQPP